MVEEFSKASELPDQWDELCGDNYALKRDFSSFMERVNPCSQRYYLIRNSQGRVDSIFMSYRTQHTNITMFTPLKYCVDVTWIHVPLSITRPGFVFGQETREQALDYIRTMPGYVLLLNTPLNQDYHGFGRGKTISQISMPVKWKSYSTYLNQMRSGYRRRLKLAEVRGAALEIREMKNKQDFGPDLYQLYEAVHSRSRVKIEKLSREYFQQMDARIFVAYHENKAVGFIQVIDNRPELVFAFVGLDYSENRKHDVYFNLLIYLIRFAIEKGFSQLEFGQTAEQAKLSLGGQFTSLGVQVSHSNFLISWFLRLIIPMISYREPPAPYRVFKKERSLL